MSIQRLLVLSLAALVACASAPARAADPFDPSDEEDRVAIEALALYPEDMRDHILEASTEAGLLQDVESLQERSQRSFRDLLEPYPQDDQQDLFDLSRYPDLVGAIAEGGPKSRGELERIAARYPEDVRDAVLRQGGPRQRVIVRMNALLDEFDDRFDDLVAELPPRKAEAFRALLGAPEVLSLLTEHGELTVLLGDTYERNPEGSRERFADLSLQVARRNADEAKDWKESVDTDPDLRRDYENAARDYEADTGYAAYAPPRTTVNVVVNPYPFWVGYPWWYPVSYNYYDPWYWWYPRRSWGYVGWGFGPRFYTGFGVGPVWRPWYPTPYFSSWYFSSGHHHARYPYLTDHYVSYYDRRDVVVVNNVRVNHYHYNKRVVKKFVHETDRVVSRDFLRGSREERVKRIREYGKVAPDLEKVQLEARRKEHGKRGRDDRLRVPDRVRDEDRAGTQKAGGEILRKREKDAPDLAKFSRERRAGDDAAELRHGKGRRDATSVERPGDRTRDGERANVRGRDAASVALRAGKTQDGERGNARVSGRDAPSLSPSDAGGKRDRSAGGERGNRSARSAEPGSGRVSPTFERPGERVGRVEGGRSRDSARGGERGQARAGRDAPSVASAAPAAQRDRAERRERGKDSVRSGTPGGARVSPTLGRPADERRRSEAGKNRESARQQGVRERDAAPDLRRRDGVRSGERSALSNSERRQAPRVERESEPRRRASAPKLEREPRREARARPEPRVERERPRGNSGRGGGEAQRQRPRPEPRISSGGERERPRGGGGGGGGGEGKRKKGNGEEQQSGGRGGRKR